MRKIAYRIYSFILVLSMIIALIPSAPAYAAVPDTLSMRNGNIEVVVSTKNGGFLIRTLEGDVITKDDNNKELLYRNNDFDTSFTSFEVTYGGETKAYIFGNNYSFLGLGGNNLNVTLTDTGIRSVWSVDGLSFTQLLEPVASESSNEHGTVKISYSAVNSKGVPVSVKARLLLDTALGKQDYAFYELAYTGTAESFARVEKEKVYNEEAGDYIPANFFAYDNYENPTMAAYTIRDESPGATWPYQIAFGHWNNMASSEFYFVPDGDLTFTNAYNKKYLTADSAMALYYDMGVIPSKRASKTVAVYYGVDSKVRVKDSDKVGITVTSPLGLELNAGMTAYLEPGTGAETGVFEITTNITNLVKNKESIEKIAVAVLVDNGITPLDSNGSPIIPPPSNKYPYNIELTDLDVGAVKQLIWKLKADVFSETSYRKIVFRAYDMTNSEDGLLLLDNVIGSSTTYILCPGGDGELPQITFTGCEPQAVYNQGTRHLYLTGSGFNLLQATDKYELRAYLKSDRSKYFVVPEENIVFTPKAGVLDIVLKETMPTGEYELVYEWQTPPPGIEQNLTAPALSFMVTADPKYRNDYYSIVAVVKEGSAPNFKYVIKTFADEKAYKAFTGNVLLVFKGEFSVDSEVAGEILSCTAVSTSDKDTININGALDFENGNVQIYQGTSGSTKYVMIEFDGDLCTTNSRTSVWSGNASLTPLNFGSDYGLIKYDERGERIFGQQPQNIISIIWPSYYNMLQTLGGMAVDMRYGEFGAMFSGDDHDELEGYIISFGGKLDASFLLPGGNKQAQKLEEEDEEKREADSEETETKDGKLYEKTSGYSPSEEAKKEDEKNKVKPVGKINIKDVLFGKNQGYLGFNSEVELMLPKYFEPLPAMGGKLSINTIGGYAVGVLGKAKTKKFELEFELKVKSAPDSGKPVPDKIYFYMAGFEPGVNIDGAGAVWLTGLGGGVDKLYDTIFSKGGVPPLTLLLSAQFDILKVMSGRSDLALSLRGFQLKLSEVKLKNTKVVVIDSGQLAVEWDPDFYLHLAAFVDFYEVIGGRSYIVVDKDFFEMMIRANIKIPKDIDVVGGMVIGNVDLGGNNNKIWGLISALGIKLGVTYYWGGDINFGTGSSTTKPTYPELLEYENVPVGVNSNTGETLYMRVGTNLSVAAESLLVEDLFSDGPILLAADPTLISNLDKTSHKLNLGDDTGDAAALTIRFSGDDRPKTVAEAINTVNIKKPDGVTNYGLTFYDGSNAETANANLMTDDEKNSTTIGMTITDYIAGDWRIETAGPADIVLYNVGAMPEVTSVTAARLSSDVVELAWTGEKLDETKISIYATKDVGDEGNEDAGDMGRLIGSIGGTHGDGTPKAAPEVSGQTVSLTVPTDLQTGNYYIRMIVSKEDEVNQSYVARKDDQDFILHFVNADQPSAPGGVTLDNAGNEMLKVNVGLPPSGSFDGYMVSLYESTDDGPIPTDFMNIAFEKNEEGILPDMLLGGIYTSTDGMTYGLEAGKEYQVKVAAYSYIGDSTPMDESDDGTIISTEAVSNVEQLVGATPPVITFEAAEGSYKTLSKTIMTSDTTSETIEIDTFTSNDVSFTLKSEVPVTGYWSIDGMQINEVISVSAFDVSSTLCDGEHTIAFTGADAEGDSVRFTKVFAVDTMPPRLMLTSPTNGSFFEEDGTLMIEGIGDDDALYTFVVDGETVIEKMTLVELDAAAINPDDVSPPDEFGVFSYKLFLNPGVSSHNIMIIAVDRVGNSVTTSVNVKNIGLANIKDVGVLMGDVVYSNGNIPVSLTGDTAAQLTLFAENEDGDQVIINDERLVQWNAFAREGSAEIEQDGSLTIGASSVGFVEGTLLVSDNDGMTGSVTFGAEKFNGGQNHLVLASTIGGKAIGEGAYLPGTKVTLTAVPSPGYRFDGWRSSNGGTFSSTTSEVTIFTMPENETIVTASFSHIKSNTPVETSSADPVRVYAARGALASLRVTTLPQKLSELVPCYMLNGKEIIVSVSKIVNGRMLFIAPASAIFYLKQRPSVFTDTQNHRVKEAIEFTASRGLFVGDNSNRFNPEGQMTRAMFAAVLARMDGVELSGHSSSKFKDVPAGSWFGQSVGWASQAGIVSGFNGAFSPNAPITKEQMAVMINNYLNFKGYNLKPTGKNNVTFKDNALISSWARDDLEMLLSLGIIQSGANNIADPKKILTRADCSEIFKRLIDVIIGS